MNIDRTNTRFVRRKSPLVIALEAFLVLQLIQAFGDEYSVSGTLTCGLPGTTALKRTFKVDVSKCLWHIHMELDGKTDFESFEYYYDGTNNFGYAVTKKSGPAVGTGIVEPGPVPRTWTSVGGEFVWMAFASSCYFHDQKEAAMVMLPLRSPHGMTRRYEVPATWTISDHAPFLPLEISYFATEYLELDDAGSVKTTALQPEFRPAYRLGYYRTLEFTNALGFKLPLKFEYIACDVRTVGVKQQLLTNLVVIGNVTSVRGQAEIAGARPTMHMEDHRFAEPFVVYKVTNGVLPELTSAYVTNARARGMRNLQVAIEQSKNPPPPMSARQKLILGLFAVFSMAPVVWFAIKRRDSQKQTTG